VEKNHRRRTRLVTRQTPPSEATAVRLAAIAPGLSHWRRSHWDEAVVVGNTAATWSSPIPRRGRESKSVYDVRLRPGRVLDGEDDPLC
jgi:hypothetical protein